MTSDDLKTVLERLKKPLSFASRDDFAHLKSLTDLEVFARAQLEMLQRIVGGDSGECAELAALFAGFDSATPDQKKDRIRNAITLIDHFGRKAEQPIRTAATGPGAGAEAANLRLDTPVQYCKGIGPKRAELLKKLGITTIEEALSYLPWRYEDRGNLKKISRLAYGTYETVAGDVVSAEVVQTKRQRVRVFELVITDGSGVLVGSWFNQPFMKKTFRQGQKVILSGIVKANPYKGGRPQIDNPDYEILEDDDPEGLLIHTGRTVPIYRATAGLSVRAIRSFMKTIIDACSSSLTEALPDHIVRKYGLMPARDAVAEAHFPVKERDIDVLNRGVSAAHRRLSFEELFILELGLSLRKRGVARETKGISFRPPVRLEAALRKGLPFSLTGAQERVINEIKRDMTAEHPMNRLVQGDVGCGKTVVALVVSLMAVENGYQACLMAPTEILAEQHFRNIASLAGPLGVTVVLLTGSLKKKAKESVLADIASGAAGIVIGTHALIEQGVNFHKLGLAIIDEQHRFGVMQRSTLKSKGYEPDVLVMTATPIPRTLALTVYGDLDVSVIDEMPPGRAPVITRLYFESKRREAYQLIEGELAKGRQVYVVYPLVEETEKSDLKAATEMAAHLQKDVFPRWHVGLLHGRMKGEEKESVMAAFKSGTTHILVSTTVIEVGVDVPNATVMVIEHPERFGLAQLHQLRGRVGRGAHQSFCVLMGPRMFTDETRDRLTSFARTNDGFRIAEEDLRLRGPGEFFGTRQSGLPDLRAANILRDAELLETARAEAFAMTTEDPELKAHAALRELVRRKWQGKLGLVSVS
jgi:ATP-dependent DNA helicase RecG